MVGTKTFILDFLYKHRHGATFQAGFGHLDKCSPVVRNSWPAPILFYANQPPLRRSATGLLPLRRLLGTIFCVLLFGIFSTRPAHYGL